MATKGASNRYGSTRGGYGKDNKIGVNYQWAKDFNKKSLEVHFKKHGNELGVTSKESYKQHAVCFANTIDKKNCKAYVDRTGTTYKFNEKTNKLVIVNKKGIIISYYKVKDRFYFYKKGGEKKWIYAKK